MCVIKKKRLDKCEPSIKYGATKQMMDHIPLSTFNGVQKIKWCVGLDKVDNL